LDKLGKDSSSVNDAMTLADIYFVDDDNNSSDFIHKQIGFGKK